MFFRRFHLIKNKISFELQIVEVYIIYNIYYQRLWYILGIYHNLFRNNTLNILIL